MHSGTTHSTTSSPRTRSEADVCFPGDADVCFPGDADVCFPGDADLTKNVDALGASSMCSLVHRGKVRYPSATLASETDGRPPHVYREHCLIS
ncbi:hypothetical protein AVEN_22922-1 [Araneus ventricosus]|uniref:Uncharacterized protein n=1 Tax=Araneus ventricosus TaxID=182803 RepID=A0A4Y2D896_ARAVE|nr:hypothetical protein AVEN_22922-1 [Araneus ventricosus]